MVLPARGWLGSEHDRSLLLALHYSLHHLVDLRLAGDALARSEKSQLSVSETNCRRPKWIMTANSAGRTRDLVTSEQDAPERAFAFTKI